MAVAVERDADAAALGPAVADDRELATGVAEREPRARGRADDRVAFPGAAHPADVPGASVVAAGGVQAGRHDGGRARPGAGVSVGGDRADLELVCLAELAREPEGPLRGRGQQRPPGARRRARVADLHGEPRRRLRGRSSSPGSAGSRRRSTRSPARGRALPAGVAMSSAPVHDRVKMSEPNDVSPGSCGVAEVGEAEHVLDASQHRVVVVGDGRDRAGRDARRQQHRADVAAAGSVDAGLGAAGSGDLAAAGGGVARGGLVEGDDQQAALLGERRRARDLRNPLAQELVGLGEAAGLAVRARRIVAVVAQVGRDEHVVGRVRGRGEIVREGG